MDGWIKLHRDMLDNKVFQNALLLKTFIWCLLKANATEGEFKPNRSFKSVTVKPGEFITSRKRAASELGCSESSVTRRLKQLQEDGCISISANSQFTRISLINWAFYQDFPKKVNSETVQQTNSERHSARTACDHAPEHDIRKIRKIKKDKKDKETASPFEGSFMG